MSRPDESAPTTRLLQWFPEQREVRLDHASERFFLRGRTLCAENAFDDYSQYYGQTLICNNEPPMLSMSQLLRFAPHFFQYQPPAGLEWQQVVEPQKKKERGKAHARIRRALGRVDKTLRRCIGAFPTLDDYHANPYAFVMDQMYGEDD